MTAEPPSRKDGLTMEPRPVCGRPFSPRGRGRYRSSGRFRQAALRRCHPAAAPKVPLPLKGAKRAVTVYECDGCGSRALGEQYCEECPTSVRPLGRATLCPHCDLPVAVADPLGNGKPLPAARGPK